MIRVLAPFLLSQVAWFACVLGGAHGHGVIGALIGLAVVAINLLAFAPDRGAATGLMIPAVLLGPLTDRVQVALDHIRFHDALIAGFWPPIWMIALWLVFASTVPSSFRWLYGRPWLTAAFGAIGGPLSYWAGAKLGAIDLHPQLWRSLVGIAIQYVVMLPLLVHWAQRFEAPRRGIAR